MFTFAVSALDIGILVGYVIVIGFIGWYAGRKTQNTTEDYFLAGRSIPWLITLCSFMATKISALTFIGAPAEGYSGDYRYFFSNVGDLLATFFVAFLFLPVFQRFKVISIYQFLQERFDIKVRMTGSFYFLLSRILATAIRIVAIAKVMDVVTGTYISYYQCVL